MKVTKFDVVKAILPKTNVLSKQNVKKFAPCNIALIKYWGKKCPELLLPVTSSLSISLPCGTNTEISAASEDEFFLSGKKLGIDDPFHVRLSQFLDLFRTPNCPYFRIDTVNDLPTSAGLATSASGFCALVLGLNELFDWNLSKKNLSILARLGSGSACRSVEKGFVEWHKGTSSDGLDSYAEKFPYTISDLQIGILPLSTEKKPIDSRLAMKYTQETSLLYQSWPKVVQDHLFNIKKAIVKNNFTNFGTILEHNSQTMHATMIASSPSILYWKKETVDAMHRVWQLRKNGCSVFFSMDAGPNLKLFFQKKDKEKCLSEFPELHVLNPTF